MFKPVEIQATAKQEEFLKKLSGSSRERHRIVERAKLVLYILTQDNVSNLKVKAALGCSEDYVKKWRKRWSVSQPGLANQELTLPEKEYQQALRGLLEDAPRKGPPIRYSAEQQCQLYELACQKPEEAGYPISHWDSGTLRLALIKRAIVKDISVSTVSRFLKKRGI